jgi:hypothetical protein
MERVKGIETSSQPLNQLKELGEMVGRMVGRISIKNKLGCPFRSTPAVQALLIGCAPAASG